jgi:hypothetical protein
VATRNLVHGVHCRAIATTTKHETVVALQDFSPSAIAFVDVFRGEEVTVSNSATQFVDDTTRHGGIQNSTLRQFDPVPTT